MLRPSILLESRFCAYLKGIGLIDTLTSDGQSVRATLALSHAMLPTAQQHFFATLSQFGSIIFTPEMAAANAGISGETARHYLSNLYNLSLVHGGGADSYRLIPLLAQFAQELQNLQ